MAKSNTIQIKLISSAETGHFYVTKKNTRTATGKLELKKYDPVVRKHVVYKEGKIKYAGQGICRRRPAEYAGPRPRTASADAVLLRRLGVLIWLGLGG